MPTTMNIADLAQRLGVTRVTVHNMLNSGRIPVPPIPASKPRRWDAAAIEAWLNPTDQPPLIGG